MPGINDNPDSVSETPDFVVTNDVPAPSTTDTPARRLPRLGNRTLRDSPTDEPKARAKDTPPKGPRRTRTKDSSGPAAKSTVDAPEYVPGRIADALKGTYAQIGMFWGMFDPQCAQVLIQNAETMANSMEKWAKDSPAVRGVLEKVITTSAIGEVVAAHAPIVMAIAMHHVPAVRNKFSPPAAGNPGPATNGHAGPAAPGMAA